jgi:hypothetical protein
MEQHAKMLQNTVAHSAEWQQPSKHQSQPDYRGSAVCRDGAILQQCKNKIALTLCAGWWRPGRRPARGPECRTGRCAETQIATRIKVNKTVIKENSIGDTVGCCCHDHAWNKHAESSDGTTQQLKWQPDCSNTITSKARVKLRTGNAPDEEREVAVEPLGHAAGLGAAQTKHNATENGFIDWTVLRLNTTSQRGKENAGRRTLAKGCRNNAAGEFGNTTDLSVATSSVSTFTSCLSTPWICK